VDINLQGGGLNKSGEERAADPFAFLSFVLLPPLFYLFFF